jgi:hypothetical protein
MFDIVEPFPLLSQNKARGWRAMVQEKGRLQAISCAGLRRLSPPVIAELNRPVVSRAPVALMPRVIPSARISP